MVYYRPLCLYVSEETLSIAGFSNLEGSHSMTFDVKGGEGAIYHGCFLNYFNKNSEFDFLNIVVIGVRRKDNQKIDYYFGTYHRKTNDINDSLEVEELKAHLEKEGLGNDSSLIVRRAGQLDKSVQTQAYSKGQFCFLPLREGSSAGFPVFSRIRSSAPAPLITAGPDVAH